MRSCKSQKNMNKQKQINNVYEQKKNRRDKIESIGNTK